MAMADGYRRLVLGAALVSTLAAAGWFAGEDTPPAEVVQAVKPKPLPPRAPAAKLSLDLSMLDHRKARAAAERSVDDVFTAQTWVVPPRAPREAPPPPPSAPPFPYIFVGKIIQDGVPTVFLARQENNYVVKAGDALESDYRVEEINGSVMTMTYLPLNMKQSFSIGEAQ